MKRPKPRSNKNQRHNRNHLNETVLAASESQINNDLPVQATDKTSPSCDKSIELLDDPDDLSDSNEVLMDTLDVRVCVSDYNTDSDNFATLEATQLDRNGLADYIPQGTLLNKSPCSSAGSSCKRNDNNKRLLRPPKMESTRKYSKNNCPRVLFSRKHAQLPSSITSPPSLISSSSSFSAVDLTEDELVNDKSLNSALPVFHTGSFPKITPSRTSKQKQTCSICHLPLHNKRKCPHRFLNEYSRLDTSGSNNNIAEGSVLPVAPSDVHGQEESNVNTLSKKVTSTMSEMKNPDNDKASSYLWKNWPLETFDFLVEFDVWEFLLTYSWNTNASIPADQKLLWRKSVASCLYVAFDKNSHFPPLVKCKAVEILLILPILLLRPAAPGSSGHTERFKRFTLFKEGKINFLVKDALNAAKKLADNRYHKTINETDSDSSHHKDKQAKSALKLAQAGELSRAAKRLLSDGAAPGSQKNVTLLQELHPSRLEDLPEFVLGNRDDNGEIVITKEHLITALNKTKAESAPGLTGWRFEHIKAANPLSIPQWANFASAVANADNDIINPVAWRILRSARLIALGKKDGGIRPIAIGESLRRLVSSALLSQITSSMLKSAVGNVQYACQTPAGIEKMGKLATAYMEVNELDPTDSTGMQKGNYPCLMTFDCKNAFNCISRSHILKEVKEHLPFLYPFVWSLYGESDPLLIYQFMDKDSPAINTHIISSMEGTQQGDTLGTLLFCLGLKPVLDSVLAHLSDIEKDNNVSFPYFVTAYADDIVVGIPAKYMNNVTDFVESSLANVSLTLRRSKSHAYSPLWHLGRYPIDKYAPKDVKVSDKGIMIAGIALGDTWYLDDLLHDNLQEARTLLANVTTMGNLPNFGCLKSAFDILRCCVSTKSLWYLRTWSRNSITTQSYEALKQFDKEVQLAFISLLGSRQFVQSEIIPSLQDHHRSQLSMAIRDGGFGLTTGIQSQYAAVVTSTFICAHDLWQRADSVDYLKKWLPDRQTIADLAFVKMGELFLKDLIDSNKQNKAKEAELFNPKKINIAPPQSNPSSLTTSSDPLIPEDKFLLPIKSIMDAIDVFGSLQSSMLPKNLQRTLSNVSSQATKLSLLETLNRDEKYVDATRLLSASGPGAGDWLLAHANRDVFSSEMQSTAMITSPPIMANRTFQTAASLRLGVPIDTLKTVANKKCLRCEAAIVDPFGNHVLRCPGTAKERSLRHDSLRSCVANILASNRVVVKQEQSLNAAGFDHDLPNARMDLVVLDKQDKELWIDITIRTAGAANYVQHDAKAPGAAAARGEKDKQKLYAGCFAIARSTATFHPLAFEVLGRIGYHSFITLKRIVYTSVTGSVEVPFSHKYGTSKSRMNAIHFYSDKWLATLSTMLQIGNSRIINYFPLSQNKKIAY